MSLLLTAFLAIAYTGEAEVNKLPENVRKDIVYAEEMCGALGNMFMFDPDYIDKADFNGDGVTDYVIDTRGYDCGKLENSLFGGHSGKALYLYISTPDGSWEKMYNSYVYEYRIKRVYNELPYFDVWIRGDVGYKVNFIRHQWDGEKLEVFDREIGVEIPQQLWKRFD